MEDPNIISAPASVKIASSLEELPVVVKTSSEAVSDILLIREKEELQAIYATKCYNPDEGDVESQLLSYKWEKWLKIHNGWRKKLVLHKDFLKPEWFISPDAWIQEATYIIGIPELRVASMLEMYEMAKAGDPFLSHDSRKIAYVSSSRKEGWYMTWFPDLYCWDTYGAASWDAFYRGHRMSLRCVIDIPPCV